jgi:hypothetical protein
MMGNDLLAICTNANFTAETLEEFAENKLETIRFRRADRSGRNQKPERDTAQLERWANIEAAGAAKIRQLVGLVEVLRQAEEALKLAYRFHHLQDPEVGSNELSDALCAALCQVVGDKGFQEWSEEVCPSDQD